ncbi:hypothetical protein [Fusobacterium sp. THCT1E2]
MNFRLIFHFGTVLFSSILAFLGLSLFIISLTKWKMDKSNKLTKRKMQISLVFFTLITITNITSAIYGMLYIASK